MSESLMKAVALMTDWRMVGTFRCRAVMSEGSETDEYELHAEPSHSSYRLTDLQGGRVSSYDDTTRERVTSDVVTPVHPYELRSEPLPVRLAFPLSLPVWGRTGDSYWMVRAIENGGRLIVELALRELAAVTGELTIDVRRRAVVRFETIDSTLAYEDIEPAVDRFWPPR
jgi:hypothetical protein